MNFFKKVNNNFEFFDLDLPKYEKIEGVRWSPSGVGSFTKCPAFAFLPSVESEAAIKGNKLHKIAEDYIIETIKNNKSDVVLSEKLVPYIEFVIDLCNTEDFNLAGVEAKFETAGDMTMGQRFSSVIDFFMLTNKGDLHIIDLKTGEYPVSPENNDQLNYYALNAVEVLKHKGFKNIKNIYLHIGQDVLKSHKLSREDYVKAFFKLKGFFRQEDLTKFNQGSHCGTCFKREVCPMRKEEVIKAVEKFSKIEGLNNMPQEKFTELYTKALEIKKLADDVIKVAKKRADEGSLKGYVKKIVHSTVRTWKDKKAVLKTFGKDVQKIDVISVKEAEKKLGDKIKDYVLDKPRYSYVPTYSKDDEQLFIKEEKNG